MMQAIEGIYHNGRVVLLETPPDVQRARVIVTFLEDAHRPAAPRPSITNLGEILTDDLTAASEEIAQSFRRALAQSALELEK